MTSQTLSAAPSTTWADPKRFLWLLSPALPLVAFAALAVGFLTDTYALAAIAPLLLYVIVPLADWWVGTDASNPPDAAVPNLETDPYYRAIVYAYIPTQYATTIRLMNNVSSATKSTRESRFIGTITDFTYTNKTTELNCRYRDRERERRFAVVPASRRRYGQQRRYAPCAGAGSNGP